VSKGTPLPPDIASAPPDVQAHYIKLVRQGQAPRFAEMVALGVPPATRGTDRALMEGRLSGQWLESMPKAQADRIIREAKQAGINVAGKFYMGGLADHRRHKDPAAWIDSVADIKKVAQLRDLHVQGIVNHTPPEKPPKRSVDIAPDILREHVIKEMRANPKLKRGEAIEKVKDRIVPHWKRKKK
jgi:hypothetical protein